MRFKALLLDFYGTIVEEADNYVAEICSRIARRARRKAAPSDIEKEWFTIVPEMCYRAYKATFQLQNDIAVKSLQVVLEDHACDLDGEELMELIRAYWREPEIYPESKPVLAQCNLQICIVSNTDDAYLHRAMEKHRLSFSHIVTSESCKAYKPRVEVFYEALSLLGISNEEALVVGDSYTNDVLGAKAVSIPVLWINRKNRMFVQKDEGPDYVSSDLRGLLACIG
jgi:2-haloacid dehalogenase/putative hydrolase of the HAD superfamily